MDAAIVAIGSELTTGRTTDTNSSWLQRRLVALGVRCACVLVCPDDVPMMKDALAYASKRARAVIVTGGLGPTDDDLTRRAVAELAGVPLELHPPSLARIEAMFARFGRPMSPTNRRQAELPRGADVLENEWGTAPGFAIDLGEARLFAVPGVPREMKAMWERHLEPGLARLAGVVPGSTVERALLTCQIAESALGERTADLVAGDPGAEIMWNVNDEQGTINVTFIVRGEPAAARARADALVVQARERLGRKICAEGPITLPQRVVELLLAKNRTLAVAESCTGGRISSWLTAVPGVSRSLLEGLVVYSNESKTRRANVPPELIRDHGAVSPEVAQALALGAKATSGADYGIGVTGIAGPDGGSPEKPVGLVWFAVAGPGEKVETVMRRLPGDRNRIQTLATSTALDLLRLALEDDA
jgi:nicotinamide-nucleotide amidase